LSAPVAIFLYSRTGIAAEPWAAAGIESYCVDIAHSIRAPRRDGLINFVWGDARTWQPPSRRRIVFVGAFPPCTHVAVSGARDFEEKGGALLRDALETFESARLAAAWSGAPYFIENPVGVLSSLPHIGRPHYLFHPFEFAGWADDPSEDAYTKKTGLWTGNGFRMPDKRPVDPIDGSKIISMPDNEAREERRTATPKGFARAVFAANCPPDLHKAVAA